jgi:hypothetical protein
MLAFSRSSRPGTPALAWGDPPSIEDALIVIVISSTNPFLKKKTG